MNDIATMTVAAVRARLAAIEAEKTILETVLKSVEQSEAARVVNEKVRELSNAYVNMDAAAIAEGMSELTRAWATAWQQSAGIKV